MSPSPQRFLILAAALTAAGAGFALAGQESNWQPAALWHAAFAIGALPMILLAMAYFVPVLTRSAETPALLALAPLTAMVAGLGIVAYFAQGIGHLRLDMPWLALVAVAAFAVWLGLRWKRCLGHPNPCLKWYAGALGAIALGLVAVAVSPHWPDQAAALRRFHIHANTLGFIGLTALGTLRVLLPTVAGRPDADAAPRLACDFKWCAMGSLCIALGAAFAPWLALAGAALYAWPLGRLIHHAWCCWRRDIVVAGSTMPLLAAALFGLALTLGHGVLHAVAPGQSRGDIALFVVAFLLPLVSGAAGHLLPVWLHPGPQHAWHASARQWLARGARPRAALFVAAGVLAALGQAAGYVLGIVGAVWLAVAMATVVMRPLR